MVNYEKNSDPTQLRFPASPTISYCGVIISCHFVALRYFSAEMGYDFFNKKDHLLLISWLRESTWRKFVLQVQSLSTKGCISHCNSRQLIIERILQTPTPLAPKFPTSSTLILHTAQATSHCPREHDADMATSIPSALDHCPMSTSGHVTLHSFYCLGRPPKFLKMNFALMLFVLFYFRSP